ncbi:4Fe-4S dicluster domain-containing protein [Thermosipho globiformans]|uniref:4Fe-4S dicluster domain-containing protein n=1 Tax=Thermosipho globiformans TaxID=380685 RepID=UPI000F8DCC59|nr:ferredoxin family protein [Thermosipho globiformans]
MSAPENAPIIGKDALGRPVKDLSVIPWWGVKRTEIEWYPTIDHDKCAGCGLCFVTCGRRVFDFDKELSKPIVKYKYNCLVGCQTCSNICPTNAITFPDPSEMKKLVAKHNVVKKSFEIISPIIECKQSLPEEETQSDFNK